MIPTCISRRGVQLLGLTAILGLSACGKSEPTSNPGEEFQKFQENMYRGKVKAGREAFEAEKFDEAIVAFEEASRFGPLDARTTELRDKAEKGKRAARVTAGKNAMASGDYDAAAKAFSDALGISIDDETRELRNEAIAKAWKKAGAEVCWMRVNGQGVASFTLEVKPEGFVPLKNQAYLYYRSFKFRAWKPGLLSLLPVPQESFGLDLSGTSFGDDSIGDLERFKSIYILDIQFSGLTNAGREKLRKTVFVQWMSL